MDIPKLQRSLFLLLLGGVTLAFLWVLTPFWGAVLWAVTLALLFQPLFQRLRARLGKRDNLAALLTLLIVVALVIVPLSLVAASLVSDLTDLVQRMRSGEVNPRAFFEKIVSLVPGWVFGWLQRLGVPDLGTLIDRISSVLLQGGQLLATRVLTFGQNTFQFLVQFVVMLYLLFFLLRDGVALSQQVRQAIPLARPHTHYLLNKFSTVLRATVKGNVLVAVVQGTLGGIALAVLGIGGAVFWGVVMAILSLLPAVGAALVWAPVAAYLLATGAVWKAVALVGWGVLVIGLSDNVLRPILVGKDTKLPDYLVLITTLGGMALFGINGFVVGPTIAAMFMACWALLQQEVEHSEAEAQEVRADQVSPTAADAPDGAAAAQPADAPPPT